MDDLVDDAKLKDNLAAPGMESSKAKITLLHGQTIPKETQAGPDTPNQENMDVTYSLNSRASGSPEADTSEDGSPSSPLIKFDPFAPGPEDMERAPRKKVIKISRDLVPQRLVFDSDSDDSMKQNNNQKDDAETMSEDQIVENLYKTLLQSVIAMQSNAFFAENPTVDEVSYETPPDAMLIPANNVCPGAPIKKVVARTANIETLITRKKLNF